MTVEITPNGTYGAGMPNLPAPLLNLMMRVFTPILRLRGMKVLTLITVGAKSGQTRETDLGWFPDGDNRWLIVASAGGAAKHPAWYYNLTRNPDKIWIRLDGRRMKVRADSLQGEERRQKYAEIAAVAPNYGEYQTKTDREIPVIRLTAVPG